MFRLITKFEYNCFSSDLFAVALHEIGHIFGLMHSTLDGTIMWPLLQNGLHSLHQDDIDGIQALYGFKTKTIPRNDEKYGMTF